LQAALVRQACRVRVVVRRVDIAVECVPGAGIDEHLGRRLLRAMRLDRLRRDRGVRGAEVELDRRAQRLVQVGQVAGAVVAGGRQAVAGVAEQGDGAAPAEADDPGLQALLPQQPRRRPGDARGTLQPHRLRELAAARELGLVVAELDPALDQVEEGRGEGDVAFRRVAVGDRADVRVHAEDLLHDHDAAARRAQRVGAPRADLARRRLQCDVASHAPRPPFSPPFQPSLQYAAASPPADLFAMPATPKVGFVSLGCPKALVDSERILTQLRVEGYELVPSYEAADVVVVNTCGFIDSAVAESLDAIGEAMAENGKVIVTGCLGKREEVIRQAHPGVLSISGPQDYASVMGAVHTALPPRHDPFVDLVPRRAAEDDIGVKLTPHHYAYLKISEGCNHRCSFCIIPSMRGDLVSRPVDDVLREAEKLVRGGVRELLVISQDTSAYGVDLRYAGREWRGRAYQTRMKALCEGLSELGVWTRLHYVYPYPHVDDIIPLMAQRNADGVPALLPYLDIPFQHASPRVLKLMKRPGPVDRTLERIARWRDICPDITIRSTFIVGFPGETDAEFEELLDFLDVA